MFAYVRHAIGVCHPYNPYDLEQLWEVNYRCYLGYQEDAAKIAEFIAKAEASCLKGGVDSPGKVGFVTFLDDSIPIEDVEKHWDFLEVFHAAVLDIFIANNWELLSEEEYGSFDNDLDSVLAIYVLPENDSFRITSAVRGWKKGDIQMEETIIGDLDEQDIIRIISEL